MELKRKKKERKMKISNKLFSTSLICILTAIAFPAYSEDYSFSWDDANANMTAGSVKPGYAQLSWSQGSVLPVKLRAGMVTMLSLPNGEQIADAVVGDNSLFNVETTQGERTMFITPQGGTEGVSTNMIVMGQSGNKYIFYLTAVPVNSSEVAYSQVDVVLDGNGVIAGATNANTTSGSMGSIFNKKKTTSNTVGVDGEDYGWIKSMKIDPSEFRFDLDIFVPNPDDYVIAPERVWRDRVFTYIDFGDKVIAMTQRPVVSLLVEGGESPVSFRTDGEDSRLLIVEAVGDMVLRSGQRVVCIKKRAKPFLIADTASVMALAEANVAQSMMSNQSLNNIAYNSDMYAIDASVNNYTGTPMYVSNNQYTPAYAGGASGLSMIPTARETAGSYLPQSNIPLISSNQAGIAVELKSDTSVKALDDYWTGLLAKFSGDSGSGLLTPYKNMVFFAVDEQGVSELGSTASTARLYRLRIGPMSDIDTAQKLCDQLLKFSGATCHVVRVQ